MDLDQQPRLATLIDQFTRTLSVDEGSKNHAKNDLCTIFMRKQTDTLSSHSV